MLNKLFFSAVGLAALGQAADYSNYALTDIHCTVHNHYQFTTTRMDRSYYYDEMYTVMFNVYGGEDTTTNSWTEADYLVTMVLQPDYEYPEDGEMVITSLVLHFSDDGVRKCEPGYERICSWKAGYASSLAGKNDSRFMYWGWDTVNLCAVKEPAYSGMTAVTGIAASDWTVWKAFETGEWRQTFTHGGNSSVEDKTYKFFAYVETAPWNDCSNAFRCNIHDFCFQEPLGTPGDGFKGCHNSDMFTLYKSEEVIQTGVNPFKDAIAAGKRDYKYGECFDARHRGACLYEPDQWVNYCPQKCSSLTPPV